jgi:hypothetical protein
MNGILLRPAAAPTTPEMAGGLPFWIIWLLLCVILLLLAIIFLRDKDLRRRMSAFLSGTRRRMVRLRLQAKLNREKEKKASLWKELGRRAWSEDVAAGCVAEECRKLGVLEKEMHDHQMAWHEIYSRIEALSRGHQQTTARFRAAIREQEDLRKPVDEEKRALASRKSEILDAIGGAAWEIDSAEGQIKALDREARSIEGNAKLTDIEKASRLNKIQEKAASLAGRVRSLQQRVPLLHEERQDLERRQAAAEARVAVFNRRIAEIEEEQRTSDRVHERELREWLRNKERVQDKIVEAQRLMEPLFAAMGRSLDEARVENDELAGLYFQIDAVNRTTRDLQARIEHLQ